MDLGRQILSDIIFFDKYARYREDFGRRETYEECIDRNKAMHLKKFPELAKEIEEAYSYVYLKLVLPSMRSLQFSGKAIEVTASRIYNCSYLPIDDVHAFSEIMFLLLGGTGTGYSVQKHHIDKLPIIKERKKPFKYLIQDSIEGWADSVKVLMRSYFEGRTEPRFDFSAIRAKGSRLVTSGGKAPGPEPLRICLTKIDSILRSKAIESKLTPLEAHDILCLCADAVLAGGIRRAAMSCLFDRDDMDMLYCKSGDWFELHPHRARANNSAVFPRGEITEEEFFNFWEIIKSNKTGEPSIFWTNDKNVGSNPCQPAWATVLTPQGLSTIGKVSIGDKIWSEIGWTTVIKKWSTGVKEVYEYRTSTGCFYGTKNHKILQDGIKIEAENAESVDLLSGPFETDYNINIQDIMDGLVIGDGTVHVASNNKVLLEIGEKDQDYFISEVATLIGKKCSSGPYNYSITTTINYKELPKTYLREIPERFLVDKKKLVGFLRGLYTANGSVISSGSGRILLKGSSKKLIQQTQLALSSLGIISYITTNKPTVVTFSNGEYLCKESYDLNISTHFDRFIQIIGFIQDYKNEAAEKFLGKERKSRLNGDIQSKNLISEEEVFDITVDNESHTYWTGGLNVSNCFEASLNPFSFCNLCEINGYLVNSQTTLDKAVWAAAFIGTLQASYTDFHYLRPCWKEATEKDALIGIGITGIATRGFLNLDLEQAAKIVVETNAKIAKRIGINRAARCTLVKPSGTASSLLGCCSGIHSWHSNYYNRRFRVGKNQELYFYLMGLMPELIEDDIEKPHLQAIVSIPIAAPLGAITREESPIDLLERMKDIYSRWVTPGWNKGVNSHTVSITVSIKDDEWDLIGQWMWDNRRSYGAISTLPYDIGNYKQPPFEEISEQEYERLSMYLQRINTSYIEELADNTNLTGEIACGAGGCDIR